MRLPASERGRWTLAVAVGILLLVALNVWWVMTYRYGYPLNVDENGYTSIALNDWLGFENGGPHGWWSAVQSQTPNAPLLPAITSLVLIVKAGVMEGFIVLIAFFALLAFAAYGIGERLAGPRLGALAALVVAASEGALGFSREYVFALPTAALLSCAVYALLRSERMRRRRWAIACGVAIGSMLLARTMAIAFVPGVIAAALVGMLAIDRTDLRQRFLNLGLMALAAVVVAATWYFHNLKPVYEYLTSFGYGTQSSYYGAEHAVISWGRFRAVTDRMIYDDLLMPLTALLVLAIVGLAIVAARRVASAEDRREAALRLAAGNATAVAIVIATGIAALMTSRNGGNGFSLPLSMLLPPLAVLSLHYYRVVAAPIAGLLVAIAGLNLAATSNLWDGLAEPHFVAVPGLGQQPWLNGVPRTVDAVRVQVPGPATHFDERDAGWPEADDRLAEALLRWIDSGRLETPTVTFASRHRAISSNSVQVALLLNHRQSVPFAQLNAEPDDSVATYVRQLTDPEFGLPSMLVAMNRNTDDFPPLVTQSLAETAARRVGFRRVGAFTLPDGRQLRVLAKARQPSGASSEPSPSAAPRPARARGSRRG
jgi:4-amino-4-deoxy-L-arabinose transferase-like glycosyltransferase